MNVTIKPLAEKHLDALYAAKNDAAVLKDIPGEYPLLRASFDEQNRQIIKAGSTATQATFTIFIDAEIAGITGHFTREGSEDIEVGYFIGKRWWGKGVATKALALNLDEMRKLGICGRVVAGHAVENVASGRVLQKAGFIRDGERAFTLPDGTVVMDPHWMILL